MTPRRQPHGLLPTWMSVLIGGGVSVLWGYDVLRALTDATHQLNGTLGTAFSIVMGALFAQSRAKKADGDDDDGGAADTPAAPAPGAISAAELIARLTDEKKNR